MIYADTNVLLALYSRDTTSDAAHAWAQALEDRVVTSWWAVIEFKANISLRVRKKRLPTASALAAMAAFERDFVAAQSPLTTLSPHFALAATWLSNHQTGLRSGDALHLATANGHGCASFATFDRELAKFGRKLGVPTKDLSA
jgi:uncharacterized protein